MSLENIGLRHFFANQLWFVQAKMMKISENWKTRSTKRTNGEIKSLEEDLDKCVKDIERLNRQLTEKELYEKKAKKTAPTGVPAIDATVDRLIKLEAKFEAKENPYFF